MARYLHHVRKGEENAQRRDLQCNGAARAIGPFQGHHARFIDRLYDPANQLHYYSGFDATGRWYQNGVAVTENAGEPLGSDFQPFNTLKWQILANSILASQVASGFVVVGPGEPAMLSVRSRFEIRGDFAIRMKVPVTTMNAGVDDEAGQDNAVWFGVSSVTSGNAWLVKHTKNATVDNPDGFAAEITGVGVQVGYTNKPGVTEYDLIVRRLEDTLHLEVYVDGAILEIWSGLVTERLYVEWGARNTHVGGGPEDVWGATFGEYIHPTGWHSYSAFASWATERSRGVLFDAFVGGELDTRIWTDESIAPGTALPGDGLILKVYGASAGAVRSVPITGDFTVSFRLEVETDPDYVQTASTVELLAAADLYLRAPDGSSSLPRLRMELLSTTDEDGVPTVVPKLVHTTSGGTTTLATGSQANRSPYLFVRMERRGRIAVVTVEDGHGAGTLLHHTTDGNVLEVAPLTLKLLAVSTAGNADWTVRVPSVQITSPHALRLDAWPGDYYGASARALELEVKGAVDEEDDPVLSQLTLINVSAEDRAPFWRMVGLSTPAWGQGQQAMPAGTVGQFWPDLFSGRIVVPVAADNPVSEGGFLIVDLHQDAIYLRRGGDAQRFLGPVAWRHLGLGYTSAPTFETTMTPPEGAALGYAEGTAGGGVAGRLLVWTTADAIRVRTQAGATADLWRNNDPGTNGPTKAFRTVLIPGVSAAVPAELVAVGERNGEIAVPVWRNVGSLVALGDEPTPGERADVIYTGSDPSGSNPGFIPDKVVGAATNLEIDLPDVHAIRPTDAVAGGLPLIAVARRLWGASIVQDNATPASATYHEWLIGEVTQSIGNGEPVLEEDDGTELIAGGAGVRLTHDANAVGTAGGWLAVGCGHTDQILPEVIAEFGQLVAIPLATMRIRTRINLQTYSATEFPLGTSQRVTEQAVTLLYPPPGQMAGLRLITGYQSRSVGVVEYDLFSIAGGPWRGPHIGGTTFRMLGWGLEDAVEVHVGGVDCFGVACDLAKDPPELRQVNRALGFIEHPDAASPVMSDDELAATDEWPHDVRVTFRDGAEIVLPDAFTYESRLDIERQLARMMIRLEDRVLANDPKLNSLQRHMALGLAQAIVQWQVGGLDPIMRDTFVTVAEGEGLYHAAGSYALAPPFGGMTEAQIRAWVVARLKAAGPTVLDTIDVLEPILGVRPTLEEGYREFSVLVPPRPSEVFRNQSNFFGDVNEADRLTGGFYDRDFWGGNDPRFEAARVVLTIFRAAGVRAILRQLEE